jgi:hypothetical protein
MTTYIEMEERISKQQLQKMYGVGRTTIDDWVKNAGLPIIQITSHKRYVLKSDLLKWEESKKGKI